MSTSTHAAESLYSQLINPSGSHIDLYVYALMDYDHHYQCYPTSMIRSTFESVLPHLQTRFAVQASNSAIEAVIDEAPWPHSEVHLGYGYAVQIVDHVSQLTVVNYMPSAAFVRTDRTLVLWGDNEGSIVFYWDEIISHIQSGYGTTIQSSAPFPGMSGGPDFLDQWLNNLPPLDEFPLLATVPAPLPPSPGVTSQAHAGASLYPQWLAVQNESPNLGGLQLALHVPGTSTPSSDASPASFGGDFPFTFTPPGNSLSPAHLVGGPNEGEDVTSDISVVSSSLSDRGVSPVPSVVTSEAPTSTTTEHFFVPPAAVTGTSSFRRHSVGQTDAPLGRTGSDRTVTKRGMSEDVNVDGDAFNMHQNQHVPVVPDVRASKRLRPFTITASSAPALLTVPLPTVDPANTSNTFPTSRSPTPAPSMAPAPAPVSPSPVPVPAPAPRRGRRRGGGASSRVKRTQCKYCNKSFSRVQDAQRHVAASCEASPEKAGVECPECGSVLSRQDAAQRHWRGHENPTCETPEWALRA